VRGCGQRQGQRQGGDEGKPGRLEGFDNFEKRKGWMEKCERNMDKEYKGINSRIDEKPVIAEHSPKTSWVRGKSARTPWHTWERPKRRRKASQRIKDAYKGGTGKGEKRRMRPEAGGGKRGRPYRGEWPRVATEGRVRGR